MMDLLVLFVAATSLIGCCAIANWTVLLIKKLSPDWRDVTTTYRYYKQRREDEE